ncbi:homeobox protein CDX-1 isoform X2 [Diachasma alloeum]|uniref:homeobox protein CDX-1 isoform X2 n=1 Tax=Diachasma alloeum TaxID=454923 RepID=UPI0007383CA7|nr:homeobox protein CDX-1 isoform X2 [Diachasma alloeum]
MTEISMVSYYNHLSMYRQQQQNASSQQLAQQSQPHVQAHQHAHQQPGGQQYWHPGYGHHHQASGAQQYLEHSDVFGWPHPHAHPYSQLQQYHQQMYQAQNEPTPAHQTPINGVADWSGDEGNNNGVGTGEPSPPITVSGSEISSPGTPSSPNGNNNSSNAANNNSASSTPMRPAQLRSPYEWIKRPSYQHSQNPACSAAGGSTGSLSIYPDLCILDGKTRTKDKYRVVYSDNQRFELETEFCSSKYITIRRKAELAAKLQLSERQVKIWFQNRRAKERKQGKKRMEMEQKDIKCESLTSGGMASLAALGQMTGMLGGLMHNSGSPPLALAPPLGLGHPSTLHTHQHPHPHTVMGL